MGERLLVDAQAGVMYELNAPVWRKVAKATMEADVWQLSAQVIRVGGTVEFTSPLMTATGVVVEVHHIAARGGLLYSLIEASVHGLDVPEGAEPGLKFGSVSCAFSVNGDDFSGNCTRMSIVETIGGGPRRDSLALALERHDLDRQREDLEKREDELQAGRTRRAVETSEHIDIDDHDECRAFIQSLRVRDEYLLHVNGDRA